MNALEQLRQHTKVVADTGDFAAMKAFKPPKIISEFVCLEKFMVC